MFIQIRLLTGINLFAFVLVLFGICSSFAENHAAVFGQVGNFASVIVLHHRTVDYKLSFCQVVGNKDKNEEKNTTQMWINKSVHRTVDCELSVGQAHGKKWQTMINTQTQMYVQMNTNTSSHGRLQALILPGCWK